MLRSRLPVASAAEVEEVDVVVIGSGLAGLSCAALLASRGLQVAVLEQHYEIGGCAHSFTVGMDGRTIPSARLAKEPDTPVFHFEAGPSLYSGLSPSASPHPLKHIFQMIGEEPEWIEYDTWGAHLPEVPEGYELSIGADNFKQILSTYGGPAAVEDWAKLEAALRPLSKGVMALPSTAVRDDVGVLLTLGAKYPRAFLDVIANAGKIVAPFDLEAYGVRDPFLRNYLDLLAFLLQVGAVECALVGAFQPNTAPGTHIFPCLPYHTTHSPTPHDAAPLPSQTATPRMHFKLRALAIPICLAPILTHATEQQEPSHPPRQCAVGGVIFSLATIPPLPLPFS
jgi:phytoene dehydrogenase-like protein